MYDDYNGWLVSEFESAEIPKSPSKVTEAILEIAEQKPFYGIESVENNRIVILTTFNSEVSKTVICVTLQPSEDSTRVHASTRQYNKYSTQTRNTSISRKLIVKIFKYFGLNDEAKKFSRDSNKSELASFFKGSLRGIWQIIKILVITFVLLAVIGLIASLF